MFTKDYKKILIISFIGITLIAVAYFGYNYYTKWVLPWAGDDIENDKQDQGEIVPRELSPEEQRIILERNALPPEVRELSSEEKQIILNRQ